jgi:hypothetical protein
MNKNEQNRLVAWRLRVLHRAEEMPRGVALTCRHYGLSRVSVRSGQLDSGGES